MNSFLEIFKISLISEKDKLYFKLSYIQSCIYDIDFKPKKSFPADKDLFYEMGSRNFCIIFIFYLKINQVNAQVEMIILEGRALS